MKRILLSLLLFPLCFFCLSFAFAEELPPDALSAGEATVFSRLPSTFEQRSKNLTGVKNIRAFNIGNDFFANPWVPNRSSTSLRDGLGGLFNNNACQDCHIRDGRGQIHNVVNNKNEDRFASILIRTSRAKVTPEQHTAMLNSQIASIGDSSVGGQIQHQAIPNVTPEASLDLHYKTLTTEFTDGYKVELRKPVWQFEQGNNTVNFDSDTIFSPRIAQPMIGLGLLSLIPEEHILRYADPEDTNNDGISGKANRVWNIENQQVALGRFGWKAGQPTIKQQAAAAFVGDMGLTSALFPQENCMPHQADCLNAANGNGDSTRQYPYEVSDKVLERVVFYSSHLGVPVRQNVNSRTVKLGKQLFNQAQCSSCHIEKFVTASSNTLSTLAEQTIYPYTDLLLHDMGEGLADFTRDNQAAAQNTLVEYLATAREWRTPPLWGLGLTQVVNPKSTFLHDGRARTIMEAILWHGGEAETAKQQVLQFNAQEREAIIAFLESL